MPISYRHARSRPASTDVVAIGVTDALDAGDLPGLTPGFLAARGFEGAVGQTLVVPGRGDGVTLLVGLGSVDAIDPVVLRRAGAAAARAVARGRRLAVDVHGALPEGTDPAAAAAALVEGVALAGYRFRAHKSGEDTRRLESVTIVAPGGKAVAAAVERAAEIAGIVAWVRDLVNEPGGSMTPVAVTKEVRALARRHGLRLSVMEPAGIRKAGLGGLLGVNRGSEQPPRFLTLAYEPAAPSASIALVGKGITFDSGGLSIKTADGMSTMKSDMGGAAAVLGAMAAIATTKPSVAVTAYVPLTDNMTGGDATRPGDVLEIRGGTTVEVLNTDAEGRLVLADALVMASEPRPDAIVDVATLTGACMVALGNRIAGLMGRDDDLLERIEASSARTGERVWRLPLPDDLRPQLDSKVADLKNVAGGRYGGALVAGLFLREFVAEDIPWAHLDIAGPAWSDDDRDEVVAGGTGFGVRLLLDLVESFATPA